MTRILIIGATGALGSELTIRLRQRSEATILGTTSQVSAVNKDLVFCDLIQENEIFNIIQGFQPDYIYNLAASFSTDIDRCLSVNFQASLEILKSIKKLNISTRVVLIGSAAEYGSIKSEDNPIKESHPLLPVSAYGFSKACQSNLISFFSAHGVNVVGARIFNLLGKSISEHLFIGRVHRQISEILTNKRKFLEIGSLEAYRDYISMEKASEILIEIGEKGESGQIYHIASGVPIQMRDLLYSILRQENLSPNIVLESANYSSRPGYDVPIIYADINKTDNLLTR